ncbi:MAG: hypothetical protein OXE78_00345 [Gammaproteobacteria bacterium]|nr:hypothetical protein [Gammaproteobacteria bacterium]
MRPQPQLLSPFRRFSPVSWFLPPCLVIAVASAGRSNQAVYESIQLNQLRRCQQLPIPQQAGCREGFQTSWGEYSRQRSESLEDGEKQHR